MRTSILLAGLTAVAMASGCVVAVPAGEPVYAAPVVVQEAPVVGWGWFPWPHHVVEHNYRIEDEHVQIRDHHYYPQYDRAHPYVRNDQGKHKGWFKHND